MNGRKNIADEGTRCIEFDDEERLRLEKDIEVLQKRICEFEIYLMQMDAAVGGLMKERDKIDQENIELQKENEKFHQEIKFEKIHNADLKNELKKARRSQAQCKEKGVDGEFLDHMLLTSPPKFSPETKNIVAGRAYTEFSNSAIFGSAHPWSILKAIIQRVLLFTWWSGFWFYEGLSIFGWENKWEKMERKKKRLEEENKEIESEVVRLKKYIEEQQTDLISQKHINFELLNQLTECVDVNNRKIMVLEEIWKKVEGYTTVLEDHFIELKNQDRQPHVRVSRGSLDHACDSHDDTSPDDTSPETVEVQALVQRS